MGKKILVLGSSGQIGAPLTKYLRELGHDVSEFDIVRAGVEDLRIHDNVLLDHRMNRTDFVFFLAFDIGGAFYMKKYQDTYGFISNNTNIMAKSFKSLHKYKVPFIFASSQMSNMSYSSYGRLKAVGESYTESLGGLIVKFWNVYGVEHDKEKAHVITDFIDMARERGEIRMRSDGREWRQFLHTDDCSRGLVELMENYDEVDRDRELHMTSFEWTSVLDVANIVSDLYDGVPIIPSEDGDDIQQDARNEPDGYVQEFWVPELTLAEGIKKVNEEM